MNNNIVKHGVILPRINNKIPVVLISINNIFDNTKFDIVSIDYYFHTFKQFKRWLKLNGHFGSNARNGVIGWNDLWQQEIILLLNKKNY